MNNEIFNKKLYTMGGDKSTREVTIDNLDKVLSDILNMPAIIAIGSLSPHFVERDANPTDPKVIWKEELLRDLLISDPTQLRMLRTYFEKRIEVQRSVY